MLGKSSAIVRFQLAVTPPQSGPHLSIAPWAFCHLLLASSHITPLVPYGAVAFFRCNPEDFLSCGVMLSCCWSFKWERILHIMMIQVHVRSAKLLTLHMLASLPPDYYWAVIWVIKFLPTFLTKQKLWWKIENYCWKNCKSYTEFHEKLAYLLGKFRFIYLLNYCVHGIK